MAKLTDKTTNVFGIPLKQIDCEIRPQDIVEVDGVHYYTYDFGGYIVGSRSARAVDAGDNRIPRRKERFAPEPLDGLARPAVIGNGPCQIEFSAPEIVSL